MSTRIWGTVAALASAVVLTAVATHAATSPQQACDDDRIAAWRNFVRCIQKVLIKEAGGAFITPGTFDGDTAQHVAMTKCRRKYFSRWAVLQRSTYGGSTCARGVGERFADNGDGTVTDHLTGLAWEKKVDFDFVPNAGNIHDADNRYTFSAELAPPYLETGSVFTSFVPFLMLEGTVFDRSAGWRVPTVAELQTIVLDFPCNAASCVCPTTPCIDPTVASSTTPVDAYLTVTSTVHHLDPAESLSAWAVASGPLPVVGTSFTFPAGGLVKVFKSPGSAPISAAYPVRGVRGGL